MACELDKLLEEQCIYFFTFLISYVVLGKRGLNF